MGIRAMTIKKYGKFLLKVKEDCGVISINGTEYIGAYPTVWKYRGLGSSIVMFLPVIDLATNSLR
tara:strand:+ start:376 stop:570 length:195 start_codon:yes stop_codon:yes gene_type:complete